MKKLFSLVAFALFVASMPVCAQLQFGIVGGLNITQIHLSDNDYKDYVNKTSPGFTIGPTVVFTIPKTHFGLDVSALFDLRGAKSVDDDLDTSVKCASFQFPVNLRYGFTLGDMVNAFVFAGPQFGVNTGNKNQYIASGRGRTTGHDMERRWVANNSTMSMNLGIGGTVMDRVQVKINYNFAFNAAGEIRQVDLVNGNYSTLATGKAHACQVTLGYLF
jgi:hypothetical protein